MTKVLDSQFQVGLWKRCKHESSKSKIYFKLILIFCFQVELIVEVIIQLFLTCDWVEFQIGTSNMIGMSVPWLNVWVTQFPPVVTLHQ